MVRSIFLAAVIAAVPALADGLPPAGDLSTYFDGVRAQAKSDADASAAAAAKANGQETIVIADYRMPINRTPAPHEAGLVARRGTTLVTLYRGKLITLGLDGKLLDHVAFKDVMFDQVLVRGNRVLAIAEGPEDKNGATIAVFLYDLDAAGHLMPAGRFDVRGSRHAPARLIDGRLILFTGDYLAPDPDKVLPALRRGRAGFEPLVAPRSIAALPGSGERDREYLSTVIACEVMTVACKATAVLSREPYQTYLSDTAAYLWTSHAGKTNALLARMPFDGSRPAAIAVHGSAADTGIFREKDGVLQVLVHADRRDEAAWAPHEDWDSFALFTVKLAEFGDGTAAAGTYRDLAIEHSRDTPLMVGNYLLAQYDEGIGSKRSGVLRVVDLTNGAVTKLTLPDTGEIYPMGRDAVLRINDPDKDATILLPVILPRHGTPSLGKPARIAKSFFVGSDIVRFDWDNDILGVPFGRETQREFPNDLGVVAYFRWRDGRLARLGELSAHADRLVDDQCESFVCGLWFGNTQPLFVDRRIFALTGYELIEAVVDHGKLRETRRTDFTPPRKAR